VIMNLALNARDAMPGGGEFTIKTEDVTLDEEHCKVVPESRPGEFVLLSASDMGVGIDKKTLEHIFEPFFTTKDVGKGTGLGLSYVYGVVKHLGGWINVHTEPEKGSIFHIYLPAISGEPAEEAKEAVPFEAFKGRGESILVVEDEEEVRKYCTSALTENGYTVLEASNAKEALYVFERENRRFDLVLSDVVLPDMRGPQLVEKLLSIKPTLKAILNSGYRRELLEWDVISERGFRFLQKPYSLADLLKAVKETLEI
jgi:CheY-like chemotaxis protein